MNDEERRERWTRFFYRMFDAGFAIKDAAIAADEFLAEFDARFTDAIRD